VHPNTTREGSELDIQEILYALVDPPISRGRGAVYFIRLPYDLLNPNILIPAPQLLNTNEMDSIPSFHLLLLPKSKDGSILDAIVATITFQVSSLRRGDILVFLHYLSGNTPCQIYTLDRITAKDELGDIPLRATKSNTESGPVQNWHAERIVDGQVSVQVTAIPRTVDEVCNSPSGSRSDIQYEKGGLQGDGNSFIPLPPLDDEDTEYSITVAWNLEELAKGSKRAVCSYKEGPAPVTVRGTLDKLISSAHFMVGDIYSYPTDCQDGNFGYYWIGSDTPDKIKELGSVNQKLYECMSAEFEANVLVKEPYRVFARRTEVQKPEGGTAGDGCYVLEYNCVMIKNTSQEDLLFLLAHEMVHNWLMMDSEDDGAENQWYIEG